MLVDGARVPTFPNARNLVVKPEFAHLQQDDRGDAPAILADSVRPVVDAGLAVFVEPDHVVTESVRLSRALETSEALLDAFSDLFKVHLAQFVEQP